MVTDFHILSVTPKSEILKELTIFYKFTFEKKTTVHQVNTCHLAGLNFSEVYGNLFYFVF